MSHAVIAHRHTHLPTKISDIICFEEPDNRPKTTRDTLEETAPEVDYTNFNDRIRTYENWPSNQVSKVSLANAGFIYTGENDIVLCPFCKVEGYRWVSGDNPMDDHRVWSPNCPFIRTTIAHDHSEGSSRTIDTCGLYGLEILPNSVPEDSRTLDFKKLGIHKVKGALYEDKNSFESRLATFENWPKSIKQRPADLAEAGFYYTGVGDQTLCFYCGGGLKDWEENDEPWEQHALWFSKCVYLNLKKGAEYIEKVKEGKDQELSLQCSTSGVKTKEEPAPTEALSEKCEQVKNRETEEAAEKTLCKICYKNELGVVFLPCGHIVACVDCAAALKTCAVCRKPLQATVRAFLS